MMSSPWLVGKYRLARTLVRRLPSLCYFEIHHQARIPCAAPLASVARMQKVGKVSGGFKVEKKHAAQLLWPSLAATTLYVAPRKPGLTSLNIPSEDIGGLRSFGLTPGPHIKFWTFLISGIRLPNQTVTPSEEWLTQHCVRTSVRRSGLVQSTGLI